MKGEVGWEKGEVWSDGVMLSEAKSRFCGRVVE